MTILLVEDNEMNRDMLSRRLIRRGFEVLSATSGEQVFEMVRNSPVNVILMDIGLPGIDGWEATRRLKSNKQMADIPVIALTAHALNRDREEALASGCDEYETKPIDFVRLLKKIELLTSRFNR